MTTKEIYEILQKFIENDFHCLEKKVDWMFGVVILLLGGLVVNLIILITK